MAAEETAGKRLAQFRETTGLKQREFASSLGFSAGLVGQIESEAGEPSRNFLQRLSERYSVNADWLLYGRGPMLHEPQPGFSTGHGGRIEPPDYAKPAHGDFSFEGKDYAMIRRYDVNLSAGPGLVPLDGEVVDQMAFSSEWLRKNQINEQLCGLVRVRGDSMAPTIPDGALVLVHMAERAVPREGIYAFSRDGSVYVKRLIPVGRSSTGSPETLLILSDNPTGKSESLEGQALAELNIAGRVRSVLFSV